MMCFLNGLKSKAYFFKDNQSHDNLNCAKVLLLLIVSIVLLLLMPTTNTHLSRSYSAEILNVSRLIQCLDRFSVKNNNTFHIAFIGDSRIRQLFSRFAESIPKYDRVDEPFVGSNLDLLIFHKSITTASNLLRVVFSFHWQNLLLDNKRHYIRDLLEDWLNQESQPNIVVIGIATHHMLRAYAKLENEFFKELERLVPLFRKIKDRSKIIWLKHYPPRGSIPGSHSSPSDVNADKIKYYNLKASHILRRIPGIEIWESGDLIVDEYLRSCLMNVRDDNGYMTCVDSMHPGSAVSQVLSQLLLDEICLD